MAISSVSGYSFYAKFMNLLSQDKKTSCQTETVESTQLVSAAGSNIDSQTSSNEIAADNHIDKVVISAEYRTYMQISQTANIKITSGTVSSIAEEEEGPTDLSNLTELDIQNLMNKANITYSAHTVRINKSSI